MSHRMERVNVLLRQEISRLLTLEIRDPRLPAIVSITRVETANDLRSAKVFVSVLGDRQAKTNALTALRSASGYIHRNMRNNISLKKLPHMDFRLDESIERGAEVLKLIDESAPEQDVEGIP